MKVYFPINHKRRRNGSFTEQTAACLLHRLEAGCRPVGYTPDYEPDEPTPEETELQLTQEYQKLRENHPRRSFPASIGWKVSPTYISFGEYRQRRLHNMELQHITRPAQVQYGETENDLITDMTTGLDIFGDKIQGKVNQLDRMIRENAIRTDGKVLAPHRPNSTVPKWLRPSWLQRNLDISGEDAVQLSQDFKSLDCTKEMADYFLSEITQDAGYISKINLWALEALASSATKGEDIMSTSVESFEALAEMIDKDVSNAEMNAAEALLQQDDGDRPAELDEYHPITVNVQQRTWLEQQSRQFRTLYRAICHTPRLETLSRLSRFTWSLNIPAGDESKAIWDLIAARRKGLFNREATCQAWLVNDALSKTRKFQDAYNFLNKDNVRKRFGGGVMSYLWKTYKDRKREVGRSYLRPDAG